MADKTGMQWTFYPGFGFGSVLPGTNTAPDNVHAGCIAQADVDTSHTIIFKRASQDK